MEAPAIELTISEKFGRDRTVVLSDEEICYTICRGYDTDNPDPSLIMIPDEMVSRVHCSLAWTREDGWLVADLGSTNGTFLDGRLLTEPSKVAHGITLGVGRSLVRISLPSEEESTADETVVLPARDDEAGNDEPTIVVGGDATVVGGSEDEETVVAQGDGETVVSPPGDDLQTMVAGADTPADAADEKTMVAGSASDEDTTVYSGNARDEASVDGGREDAILSQIDDAMSGFGASLGSGGPGADLVGRFAEAGLINSEQAQRVASRVRESGRTFFSEMVSGRSVDENRKIYRWVAEQYGHELIEDLPLLQDRLRDPVDWLPPNVAERRQILLLKDDEDGNGEVRYCTTDPFDLTERDWIERRTRKQSDMTLVLPSTFREMIGQLRSTQNVDDDDQAVIPIMFTFDEEQDFRDDIVGQDVPRIVEYLMHRAYVQKASDIHVEPTETGLLVRNRVDGMLHDEIQLPPGLQRAVTSRIKILANMDVAEKRRPQDGRISVIINKSPIDIRASSYPTVHGEKIVMRLLDRTSLSPRPDDLGLSDKDLQKLLDKINAPLGLIMLSGPTGSGKTTTLYSCLGSIDRRTKNVLTVEDPVEYRLDGVHQMQVNEKIGVTFAAGLRTILRQDPDVIMVGECRDTETANMAIQASLTGHIVFSTIHANDAIGVVTRLLDMEIDPFLVSSALTLAIAQRLVRTVCQNCSKVPVQGEVILQRLREDGVSDEKLENLGIEIDPDLEYVNPTGCHVCRDTGYSGRRPVFEVFEMTNECRRIVMSDDFDPGELSRIAHRNGMETLVEYALRLVDEGITTHAEIIRVLGENDS